MYSILKNNHSLVFNAKSLVKNGKLKRFPSNKLSSLCSSATVLDGVDRHDLLHGRTNDADRTVLCLQLVPLDLPFSGRRSFHTGAVHYDIEPPHKPSSKVEETVAVLKEKAKKKAEDSASAASVSAADVSSPTKSSAVAAAPQKKSWKRRFVDELIHYYHGFRLLFINVGVSRRLAWRILNGKQLTRREHKLLVRTVGDMFRLVPFSVFVVVPFLEFTLPLFLKFFPNMLPSTFQTSTEHEDKVKQSLKVKLEMAKFLQKTLDDMAVSGSGHSCQSAKDFAEFFAKVRTSGEMTTSEEIMKFSKLFEDEITLDSLPRPQLMALCRVLDMNPIGTTNFLRFQLRLKLRSLAADDMMIQKEGVNALNQSELQAACRARGMKALGVSEERLKAQLNQWLDLSLNKKVPPSLLLLSQAFMLPDSTPTEEKLAATIQALPDVVGTATKVVIGEREGKVDYKTKIDIVREELARIKEERKEEQEEDIKTKAKEAVQKQEEIMVDTAPTLIDKAAPLDPAMKSVMDDIKRTAICEASQDEVTNKDMEVLESAIETLGKDKKKLLVEKEELQELREEMAEYQEDIADLQKVTSTASKEDSVKESVAAKLLFKKVNTMINKMEKVLHTVEKKCETDLKSKVKEVPDSAEAQAIAAATAAPPKKQKEESLRIDDLISTIRKLQSVPNSRLDKISEVLSKMDADKDGVVRVDLLLKMLEIVGHEKVHLSKKQIDELVTLIDKEEAIEVEECQKKEDLKSAARKDKPPEDDEPPKDKPMPPAASPGAASPSVNTSVKTVADKMSPSGAKMVGTTISPITSMQSPIPPPPTNPGQSSEIKSASNNAVP